MVSDREEARRNTRARFEQWARNPTCHANTLSAVHNVRMADAARRAGITPSFGQSPFALAAGLGFERSILQDDAQRLIHALVDSEVLPPNASGLLDLRLRVNGGPRVTTIDQAIIETTRFFHSCAQRQSRLPAVVAGSAVRIPQGVMLPEANLIIDVLAVRTDGRRPRLIVGEIKGFPDRGGYTSRQDLAAARAQAGVYLHAVQLAIEREGLTAAVEVAPTGFLVLARPGSWRPSVRAGENLRFQAMRAARGFARLEKAAHELALPDPNRAGDALIDAVLDAPTAYSEACLSFCDLAPRCFERALTEGDAIILGEDVRRFLGEIRLKRVVRLLEGASPKTKAEHDLLRRIREIEGVAP
jgi:hypothetical protein